MKKSVAAQITQLSGDIYKLTFYNNENSFSAPGQYAVIEYGDVCRAYQVCDYDSRRFTIVFSTEEEGGKELANIAPGTEVGSITGQGCGFDVDSVPDNTILAADSSGIPEMLELARCLITRGRKFKAVLGYETKNSIYMVDSFRNICSELEVLTLDGSNGREGKVSDVIRNASYVCASGSPQMLRALAEKTENGQFSLSEMLQTKPETAEDCDLSSDDRIRRCMIEGPVFNKNNINWDRLGEVI